jgi:hypothetical protein
MPQQNYRFLVVISSLKYTLQNVVFLSRKNANLLICEHYGDCLLIYASQPSANTLITNAIQSVSTAKHMDSHARRRGYRHQRQAVLTRSWYGQPN